MKKVYRHIGYYNEPDDIKDLFLCSADEIVNSMFMGFGNFHNSNGDCESDIEDVENEHDANMFAKTDNGSHLVRYQRGGSNFDGWFIDIYVQYEIETNVDEGKIEEYCPYCENEVMLDNELKVQVCPECGHAIVPCSICSLDSCCSPCPLDVLCRQRNEDDYREMSLGDFLESFINEPPLPQSLGFNIRIDYKDKEKDILTFDYESEKGLYRLYNLSESGKAFTWKEIPSPGTLFDGLWNVTGEEMDTIYVKPNF